MKPEDLVEEIKQITPGSEDIVRLATVAGADASNRVSVQFDGEASPTSYYYKRAGAYWPVTVGDRVIMLRIGPSWIVLDGVALD